MTLIRAKPDRLRLLPSVDNLLRTDIARALYDRIGRERVTTLARRVIAELRAESNEPIGSRLENVENGDESARVELLTEASKRLKYAAEGETAQALRRVINATGVVLHTNLGRAPLSRAARRRVAEEAARYCTLEFDTETGGRGRRGARVEELLTQLTGAEAALVVNNCAAAALLVLATLARHGETIISRGELVEIGGDFRVPDVMRESGTRMIEVGTTNRTRISDYEQALTADTRLICRVHPSNYRIVGFTAAPSLSELAHVAHAANLLLYEDAGSGALACLSLYGLEDEPVIRESIAAGADIVSFSGDKLLGGAQSGLIVGRLALIERLRQNPLVRALRADKLVLAALEATLEAHVRKTSFIEIPALRMIALPLGDIERRARAFAESFTARMENGVEDNRQDDWLGCELIEGRSAIGGGAAPTTHPPTMLIALAHRNYSATDLQCMLRQAASPPVIARVIDERLMIDLRTVSEDEEDELLNALCSI